MASTMTGPATTAAGNIVVGWLKSLHLGHYAESFLDNGYDDLEICKQVGEPDLDAIGVLNPAHRQRLLHSVRCLREEGAAAVYFTLEEAVAVHEQCLCESETPRKEQPSCSTEPAKYADEYEEGKAELVKIPRIQLKRLLRERLTQDGIRLSLQPYSTTDGDRGYLEGLASRYADLLSTHYGDVLDHLEELRRCEWDEMSPRMRVLGPPPPAPPPAPPAPPNLTTSLSQPIYVPGKYSPSSCLTDKEEDEIYGFGYGAFGRQMLQHHQQRQLLLQAQRQHQQQNYQSCLSPRSAYFYEFPPSDNCLGTAKKKATTFSRLLRGLKAHRKEKHGGCSPKSSRRGLPPQRVDTPDSVLQSGLGLEAGPDTALRSMVDPRDYDRLRYFQMNGGGPQMFEETIHRLKVQEAQKKREKYQIEHEEILRDIRHGMVQMGREGARSAITDDTYMYDDEARMMGLAHAHGHWYDEPPYESDPEDFLMSTTGPVPTATIQNGRVCFTLNLRNEPRGEGVISLRSAGDISLPREGIRTAPRRGLILPQSGGYPTTIIPLRTARDRESGDYAGSDIQSVSSRLSGLSVETTRSEQLEGGVRGPVYRQMGYRVRRPDEGLSPNSSDYEDQGESETDSQHVAIDVHKSADDCEGVSSLVGRVRGLRQDVQRKISRLRQEQAMDVTPRRTSTDQAFPCSNSSFESLPSGSGSSTQALVRAGSNHSSISAEDNRELSPTGHGPHILCRARAVVDFTPSMYEKDALRYKKGDIIDVINMNASGIWRGILHNKIGHFKFLNVEVLPDRLLRNNVNSKWIHKTKVFGFNKSKPGTVEELLHRINLQEHVSVFVHNGYDDIELFKEIEPSDLDYLGIMNADHRARILTAVQLLHDLDCSEGDIAGSSSEGDDPARAAARCGDSPFGRRQFPRDSGCYDAPLHIKTSPLIHRVDTDRDRDRPPDSPNNLDSVVVECNNEILKRVESAQHHGTHPMAKMNALKDTDRIEQYHPNIPVSTSVAIANANEKCVRTMMDSYVVARGQTVSVESRARGNTTVGRSALRKGGLLKGVPGSGGGSSPAGARGGEDSCESDHRLNVVRFVAGAGAVGAAGAGGVASEDVARSCPSEKSSDSGVSSSSLSSAPRDPRDPRDPRELRDPRDPPTQLAKSHQL